MGVIFDKLFFVKRLADAGMFTRPQAEALSEAFHQAVAESVATKQDVDACRTDIQHEVALFRSETKADLAEFRSETKADLAELRSETKAESAELRSEMKANLAELRSEMKIGFAELRSGNAETRVWTVSVGATIIAVLAAIKYFG